jgi:hypothetical protein
MGASCWRGGVPGDDTGARQQMSNTEYMKTKMSISAMPAGMKTAARDLLVQSSRTEDVELAP